jgi:hypothetical protein
VRILDEADYRRRLDEAVEISTGEEAGLLLNGISTGDSFGPLNARKAIGIPKKRCAKRARKCCTRSAPRTTGLGPTRSFRSMCRRS